jgi:sugar phosphate isomerase/epimerase/4-hydroxyphenylpyruvate dioxygenase-like putative hemolysin
VDAYQPFPDVEAVPPDVFAANLRRAERTFAVLEEIGVKTVVVCSSMSAESVDDDDLAAEQLHALAGRAEAHGLRIAYEALAWGRFVNTAAHAWRIVRRAGHPALGLCLDSFHVLARGDSAGIRTIPGEKIFHLQLADAPRATMDVAERSLHHRLFPGLGSLDVAGFLRHVESTGYDGPLSLEVSNDVYRQADPRHAAINGMRSLLTLRETAAPGLSGIVFTEMAVDDISGPQVTAALTALGFVHAGRHRSKPVELWQQGAARILLNFAAQRTVAPGTATIVALAVESADPARSIERAERLLAPVLPRLRRPGEADLASIAAPDGTSIFLVRNEAWLQDFLPLAPAGDGPVTAIDHVSLTDSVDDFDEAAIFYRAVLGLRSGETSEIAAPFGPIRSRAAEDAGHRVRIALNTAPMRRGDWAPAIPNPQQVAFGTDDAIGCARAMRAPGAPLLRIPVK